MLLWLLMRHWSHLFVKRRVRDLKTRDAGDGNVECGDEDEGDEETHEQP